MPNLIYEVVHTSIELKTVQDYIADINSPAHRYIDNPDRFLAVKNLQGLTNRQVIEATYINLSEKKQYVGKSAKVMLLKVGTRLAIEQEMIDRVGLLTQGLEVASNDVVAFKAKMLAELESKEGYSIVDNQKPIKGRLAKGSFKEMYPDVTVWIWCRSLAAESNNYEGEIFNLTPFIEKVTTSTAKNGGNFQITLPPIVCENFNGKWILKKETIQFYINKNKTSLQGTGYVAESSLYDASNDELTRNQFLFHNLIGTNDLIFIRFETLKIEGSQRINDQRGLTISKNNIPDRIYDMIGLVDSNSISINPSSNDVSIFISGRDLSKIFIEDGTYFFSLELSQGMIGGPGSKGKNGSLTQRLATDQALQYLSLYFNNSVEKVFEFVINQLSNIKVVPDSLFDAYGDRRNTRFVQRTDDEQFSKIDKQIQQLEKDCLKEIATIRKNNGLIDSSVVEEKRIIESVFNEEKRFQKAIRDQNVRQVSGNVTVSWLTFKYSSVTGVQENIAAGAFPQYFVQNLYNLLSTRLVSEDKSLVDQVDQILDLEQSKSKYSKSLTKELAPGIWQIIKLVIDKSITNRRLVDSSISTANGSLLNFFRKVCQEPFVEFYMDTYGDQFFLIARKPPTDKIGITSLLGFNVQTEDSSSNVSPAVIDIEAADVLSENLSFSDEEAVSWYHFVPQANFLGGTDAFSLAYLPAVYFEEYAEIWGSKPLQLVHNYLPMIPKDPNTNTLDIAQKQAVEDMKYIIGSSAYLPFTRKGSIKINGDRRIKIGNILRFKPTGEIFKIEGVRQDYSMSEGNIDRTTTIEVSRGMVEKFIYGARVGTNATLISYFDIVNTEPVYQYKDFTTYIEKRTQIGTKVVSSSGSANLSVDTSSLPYASDKILQKGNRNLQLLDSLDPSAKKRFTQFINAINQETEFLVEITSGKRSFEQQQALHVLNENNAHAGHSQHETGFAIDINLFTKLAPTQYLRKSSTLGAWNNSTVPQLANILGIDWGGSAFTNYFDPVHFVVARFGTNDNTTTITEPIYKIDKIPVKNKSLDISKIFSNFKVNKVVFDFFLRREQFSKQYLK